MEKKDSFVEPWRMKNDRPVSYKPYRFTLIELLITIVIFLILVALLLPTLYQAKEKSKRIICVSGQRQIMTSLINYCKDFNGVTPPGPPVKGRKLGEWVTFMPSKDEPYQLGYLPYYGYINDVEIFYCPTWTHKGFQYGAKYDANFGGWPKPGETGASVYWYFSYAYRTQPENKRPLDISKDSGDLAVIADHWTKKKRHVYSWPKGAGYFSHN